jgi:histidinol dehydrogenase
VRNHAAFLEMRDPESGCLLRQGICANDFLKCSSVIQYNHDALEEAAEDIRLLAAVEGLTAHSASVDVRLEDE